MWGVEKRCDDGPNISRRRPQPGQVHHPEPGLVSPHHSHAHLHESHEWGPTFQGPPPHVDKEGQRQRHNYFLLFLGGILIQSVAKSLLGPFASWLALLAGLGVFWWSHKSSDAFKAELRRIHQMRTMAIEEVSRIQTAQVEASLAGLRGGFPHQPLGPRHHDFNAHPAASSSYLHTRPSHLTTRVMPQRGLMGPDRDPVLQDPEWRLKHRPLTHQTLRDVLRDLPQTDDILEREEQGAALRRQQGGHRKVRRLYQGRRRRNLPAGDKENEGGEGPPLEAAD